MSKVETEIYYTRSILGSRVKVERDGPFKKTSVEHPALLASRAIGRSLKRAGRNTVELAKEFPWRNRAVQIAGVIAVAYLAHRNQPVEIPIGTEVQPQIEPQPPVEVPAISEEAAINQPFSYTIQRQDTLFGLAQRFGTSVEAILQANPWIKNRDLIHAGQELIIPGAISPETLSYTTIVGRPPTYKMAERDISFLNWLNSAHLNWRDWNGYKQRIYIPDWVYQYAKTAEVASEERCSWNQLVGIGLTETGYFKGSQWDSETISYAKAKGIMQIVPGTFKVHAPYEGADPYDPKDNMMAACNKIIYQGLVFETTTEGWVKNFLGEGPTRLEWNNHEKQAYDSKLLADELKKLEKIFGEMYEQTINE